MVFAVEIMFVTLAMLAEEAQGVILALAGMALHTTAAGTEFKELLALAAAVVVAEELLDMAVAVLVYLVKGLMAQLLRLLVAAVLVVLMAVLHMLIPGLGFMAAALAVALAVRKRADTERFVLFGPAIFVYSRQLLWERRNA